ncbi:nucleoside abc transporter membrane protein [Leptolyngbya sp. Heron Island J]|uniref:ABC transporter permease n=1 Tax=Leptolyngbya sp. Heron Island J TaxID=1385935 RepID=UPI0003B9BE3A|nr:ABC transporter permease [Leptolyngbya sp. Heron Island J]ESA33781.1 nucleoside abc transporter membrane protein [Leptolyngbya sp. Heron Island J]
MPPIAILTDFLSACLRLTVPLTFAAMGGLFSERSGVLNIGLEGMMLTGAFVSAAVALATDQVWLAVGVAFAVSALVGMLHAYLCVSLGVNQLVSGLAINLTAAGLTTYGARLLFDSGTVELPSIAPIVIPGLHQLPIAGILFRQDLLFYWLLLLIPASTYLLFRTRWGLVLRAVGNAPRAADTAGVSVTQVRYISVMLCGGLCGLAGAYLALVHVRFFAEGMSAGKGFIALAALIFGRWHPVSTALACLLFGATEALQLRIQALNLNIPYQFLTMLPYVTALLALMGIAGKATPPAALGLPYTKENL